MGMSPRVDKNVNVTMHSDANRGVRLCDQNGNKVQVLEECFPPEEERHATSNVTLCDVDPELDAILEDALLDFPCINGMDALHSMQEPRGEAYDNNEEVTEGGVTTSLELRNECLVVKKPCVGSMDSGEMLQDIWSKLLMQMLFGMAIQYAMQKQEAWQEEDLEGEIFERLVALEEKKKYVYAWDGLSTDGVVYEQEIWYGCQKPLVFDPGGLEWSLFMLDWAISFWPFDPGGCEGISCKQYLYSDC